MARATPRIDPEDLERLNEHDREYVEGIEDPEHRTTVASTILRYSRTSTLAAGDTVPALPLHRLEDGSTVRLDELHAERPLVLVFGSFT